MAPSIGSFDPDAPDEGYDEGIHGDVWDDGFPVDEWVDPVDDPALDTPAGRADWAYGCAVDPATPAEVLARVAADIMAWDVDALLAEAAIQSGADLDLTAELDNRDRPDLMVLRSLLRHPNKPEDLGAIIVRTWLQDPDPRSIWPVLVALADRGPIDDDTLVTAVTEACDAARSHDVPHWALLLVAVASARADALAVHDLLAIVPFPHDDPTRLWPDADSQAKGLPGGARAQGKVGAEALGWDGRRHPTLAAKVAEAVLARDKQKRAASFAHEIVVCPHGPVTVTPAVIVLPTATRGTKPYVARIVGSHPVFRLKRDWPNREDGTSGTAWTWSGAEVLEARDLGCDGCRHVEKQYFVTAGDQVAPVSLRLLRRVLDELDAGG